MSGSGRLSYFLTAHSASILDDPVECSAVRLFIPSVAFLSAIFVVVLVVLM